MSRKKLQPPQCGCTVFCSFVKIFLIVDFVAMTAQKQYHADNRGLLSLLYCVHL